MTRPPWLFLAWLAMASCSQRAAQDTPPPDAPSFASIMDTTKWITSTIAHVVLKHPVGAIERADSDRFSGFIGRALVWSFGNGDLRIAVSNLHPGTSLGKLVDSVRLARNKELNPEWRLAPAKALRVEEYEALELLPDCGDCEAHEWYVAMPSRWFVLSASLEQQQAFTYEQQAALYKRMLSTARPDQ